MLRRLSFGGSRLKRMLATGVVLLAGCNGGDGPTAPPNAPPAPPPDPGFASFRIVGPGGQDETVSYANGSNLVFCRQDAGFADLFIRFAEQAAADGENGPHLDIDVCTLGDGGNFAPKDAQVPSCGGGKTWGVFWHGEDAVYANASNAMSCTLSITRDGALLMGSFGCRGLAELGGNRTVDVLDGMFECTEA